MLVVEGLTCRFGAKAAVDNASFSIQPGSFVGVIGRSGAGKSTLVNLLLRFFDLEGGRILIDGQDVASVTRRACVRRSPW
jgi:phosphonate transport system ATP-binding protein